MAGRRGLRGLVAGGCDGFTQGAAIACRRVLRWLAAGCCDGLAQGAAMA
ncbi:MAG: hypothetical protein LBC51_01505 [Treponema sp.]|nr:hypothetical protein [Treponema sp.]